MIVLQRFSSFGPVMMRPLLLGQPNNPYISGGAASEALSPAGNHPRVFANRIRQFNGELNDWGWQLVGHDNLPWIWVMVPVSSLLKIVPPSSSSGLFTNSVARNSSFAKGTVISRWPFSQLLRENCRSTPLELKPHAMVRMMTSRSKGQSCFRCSSRFTWGNEQKYHSFFNAKVVVEFVSSHHDELYFFRCLKIWVPQVLYIYIYII